MLQLSSVKQCTPQINPIQNKEQQRKMSSNSSFLWLARDSLLRKKDFIKYLYYQYNFWIQLGKDKDSTDKSFLHINIESFKIIQSFLKSPDTAW